MAGLAKRIAVAATLGNLLQGWDNGALAGALLYLKPELGLEKNPLLEGIVVGSTLIGALISTICSGPGSDWLGRRAILCISAILYTASSCVMLWSPTVWVLVFARLFVGAGLGIAVTIVPIYIAETAPAQIRGELSTLPQFMGSGGLSVSYTLCFLFSLTSTPSWRIMLALLLLPSLLYLVLVTFYLPESPRWLVSKGKMLEARSVLQYLRMKTDVAAELALLVEGLGVGAGVSLEEWLIEPAETGTSKANTSFLAAGSSHMLYTPEEGVAWIAKPVEPETNSQRAPGGEPQSTSSFMDPVVAIIGSLNANMVAETPAEENYESDIEKGEVDENNADDAIVGEIDEQLTTPLISRRSSSKFLMPGGILSRPASRDTTNFNNREAGSYGSKLVRSVTSDNPLPSVGIGSGWQLAWQWEESQNQDGNKEAAAPAFRRVFLLQEGAGVGGNSPSLSTLSLPSVVGDPTSDQPIQAAALIGQPAQSFNNLVSDDVVGPAMVHPAETAVRGPAWSDMLEVGVRRALLVGIVLQILQQFSGINAVLYFVPQILQQSGADALLAQLGLGSASASILAGGVTCLIMLPCIWLAMRLMDHTGRRQMLLVTLPVLFLSLVLMVISSTLLSAGAVQAAASFLGVTTYVCVFVMGFGPIPNILGSEIFPTRVRGVCIGMCQASMWTCNILLTNMFPTLLKTLGIGGLFGCFAVVVILAWIFTFLKVPETKGMPLEVISEFFAMSTTTTKVVPESDDISPV